MILQKILHDGKTNFGMHVGIVSRINGEQYQVYAIDTDYGGIYKGDVFELQNTYCRDVISNARTMIFDDVAEISELLKHPCYLNTQLRAYIGTPIILDDQIWGTLNFSSRKPRKLQFSHSEFDKVELLAQDVTNILCEYHTNVMSIK